MPSLLRHFAPLTGHPGQWMLSPDAPRWMEDALWDIAPAFGPGELDPTDPEPEPEPPAYWHVAILRDIILHTEREHSLTATGA